MTTLIAPRQRHRRPQAEAPIAAWRGIRTSTGEFIVALDALGRLRTGWHGEGAFRGRTPAGRRRDDLLPSLCRALARSFEGEDVDFAEVELPPGPAFHRACWEVARRIPRGATISYGELARRAGSPKAARAAGQAMRGNPVPVVVPCHRVIAGTGALHGFAGSCDAQGRELARKAWLLALERGDGRGARDTVAERSVAG
ncbi:MAG: methylated-DNA--[protein]-cysteine S-methyltransferase [Phycisphaerales bacterium]